MLRGFKKVELQPGETATVTFDALDAPPDTGIWSEAVHGWQKVGGTFGVFVGASSRDIRLTGEMLA